MEFYNELIQKLASIINLLNQVEIKNFNNIKNLGAAIQQTDNAIKMINWYIQQQEQNQKNTQENKDKNI